MSEGEHLTTLLRAAADYVDEKTSMLDDASRAALSEAIKRGCTVELRICPLSRARVQLVLVGGEKELQLGHLEDRAH